MIWSCLNGHHDLTELFVANGGDIDHQSVVSNLYFNQLAKKLLFSQK